jgi:hypothetical protein
MDFVNFSLMLLKLKNASSFSSSSLLSPLSYKRFPILSIPGIIISVVCSYILIFFSILSFLIITTILFLMGIIFAKIKRAIIYFVSYPSMLFQFNYQ